MRNFLDGRSFKASPQELERSATTRTCAKCDECPDTSGASGSDNVEGGEGNSAPSSILISGLVVGLVCCIVVFLCRQQTSSSPLAVSGDDVELRNSSYSDQVQ